MGVSPRRQQAAKSVSETLRVLRMQFRGHMVFEERMQVPVRERYLRVGVTMGIACNLQPLHSKLGLYLMRAYWVTGMLK